MDSSRRRVPSLAHFIFGLRSQEEPFHLVHYLAVASCIEVLQPDSVVLHCAELPYGFYWDLLRPHVQLERVEPIELVESHAYDDPMVRRYSYAHHADFIRLDVLNRHGGMYADIDTLFIAPPPDECLTASTALGHEHHLIDPRTNGLRTSISNALIYSSPGAPFITRWHDRMTATFDGTWAAHSCFLADDLARQYPDLVHVEPARTFHHFPATLEGIRRLLEETEPDLEGVSSIHLAAHLWWEEDRRDFSGFHAGLIDEEWVRTSSSTYARAAKRFLPEHHLF